VAGALGLMAEWPSQDLIVGAESSSTCKEKVRLLIADVSDAFWLILLAPAERKYFVVRYRGRWFVVVRTAQGSRGAPLSWASTAAVHLRLVRGLFASEHGEEACLQYYVDDPLLATQGIASRQCRRAVRFCVALLVLGFGVAFDKAQFSIEVF